MARRQPLTTGRGQSGTDRPQAKLGPILGAGILLGITAVWLAGAGGEPVPADARRFVVLPGAELATPPGHARATHTPIGAGSAQSFAEGLVLASRSSNDSGAGFVITAQSDAATLARHKLRSGDVLLTIDGRPLDPVRLAGLKNELDGFDAVEVGFERRGQMRKRLLTFD
ncbi:MAG TPA: hypothetical protein VFV47_09205 [Hyphomicrobiaceae bacterium]|nr:hypothetical protein [Hyphomicrobiaceae bacterium]